MQETGPVVLIREQFPTTGPQRVTELRPVKRGPVTGQEVVSDLNHPTGRIMFMPEETGMSTEEITMAIYNNGTMVNGVVVVLRDPPTVQGVSSR